MTLALFQLLSSPVQLHLVLRRGTYLARRWQGGRCVKLYHCADDGRGFFVEVGSSSRRAQAQVLRSFVDTEALATYVQRVRLPQYLAPPKSST